MTDNSFKTRNYIFTINNYSDGDLENFYKLAASLERHHYICFGLETAPTTGTKHIQGYVQLNDAQRITFLQNYFNFQRDGEVLKFHVEIANGTPEQNREYCKKDGDFYEFGQPTTRGMRTDLINIKKMIIDTPKNIKGVIDEYGNSPQQVRYAEMLRPYYLPHRDQNVPPRVFWIFGPSGIGKTSLVYKNFSDVCSVSNYDWLGTGYNQNECFLLDDFRRENLNFEDVLKLTDRYPFMLYFKGGQIPFNSPFIIFTSPKSINDSYRTTDEDLSQLHRRIKEINLGALNEQAGIDLKNLDEKYIWRGVNDYNRDW